MLCGSSIISTFYIISAFYCIKIKKTNIADAFLQFIVVNKAQVNLGSNNEEKEC